jgi:adenylate cyclase class IV
MQEVELTCEVTPSVGDRLWEKLAGLDPQRIVHNTDRYYDTAEAALFEQAVFVRVRTTENGSRLQFKFDEQGSDKQHVICTERDFPLSPGQPLPDAVHALLRHFLPRWEPFPTWEQACIQNEIRELVVIQNRRHVYQLGELAICLDQIAGLGTFVEVEQMCEEGANTQQARRNIEQFVADIGGRPLSAGYVEMALERTQPEIYQKGQYRF